MHPEMQYELLKAHAAELRREAAIYRLARAAAAADRESAGRHGGRAFGRLIRRLLAT